MYIQIIFFRYDYFIFLFNIIIIFLDNFESPSGTWNEHQDVQENENLVQLGIHFKSQTNKRPYSNITKKSVNCSFHI